MFRYIQRAQKVFEHFCHLHVAANLNYFLYSAEDILTNVHQTVLIMNDFHCIDIISMEIFVKTSSMMFHRNNYFGRTIPLSHT